MAQKRYELTRLFVEDNGESGSDHGQITANPGANVAAANPWTNFSY